jgi:hypothetical protein
MSQSGTSDFGGAFIGALMAIWFFGDGGQKTETVRVTEVVCDQAWTDSGACPGKLAAASDLNFQLNARSGAVAMTVKQNRDVSQWFVRSEIYKDCAIVDASNWECRVKVTDELSESIGMRDGLYYRNSPPPFGFDVRGIAGLRYWWNKVSGPENSYVGS